MLLKMNRIFICIIFISLIATGIGQIFNDNILANDNDGLIKEVTEDEIEEAINWAKNHLGTYEYNLYCLRFVLNSYTKGANISVQRYNYAFLSAKETNARSNINKKIPRGAFIYFNWWGEINGIYRNWGHVGLALNDTEMIHAYGSVRKDLIEFSNDYEYIGWAWPNIILRSPQIISPGNDYNPGSTIKNLTPIFEWEKVDEADSYALAIRDIEKDKIIYNPQYIYNVYHEIPKGKLEPDKTYLWNMQARKGEELSSISNTLYFQTESEYEPIEEYTLTMKTKGSGSIIPSQGSYTYKEGETVNISASPDEGWEFSHWQGEIGNEKKSKANIVIDEDKLIKAVFIKKISDDRVVNINDPILKELIINELLILSSSIDLRINEKGRNIYSNDLKEIKFLDSQYLNPSRKIDELDGIEYLVNLEKLIIENNTISDLSALKEMSNLRELHFSFNKVNDLTPLEDLQSLERLSFVNNYVDDISALKKLANLIFLNFADNNVQDVKPLAELVNLEYLNINNNKVKSIDGLENLNKILSLNFNNNIVRDVSPLLNNDFYWSNSSWSEVYIDMTYNQLDISSGSKTLEVISKLKQEEIFIEYKPQN